MDTSADRLRRLIEQSGQSKGDFATAVGLDPSKMSKTLAGARRLSSLDLARIAEHAGVSVDWLLTGDEAPLALAARAASGSRAEAATAAARSLVELRASAARLGYPQPWRPVPFEPTSSLAWQQGAELAAAALERVGDGERRSAELDIASVIEAVFGVDVCLTPLGQGFDGLAASTAEAKLILASVTPTAFRQRFTIAHELGHLLAGDDQGVHLDEDIYGPGSKSDSSEVRANAFAAAFLMPEGELREAVGPGVDQEAFARLSMQLMVSPNALTYRLKNLRLIDDLAATRLGGVSATQAARVAGTSPVLAAATAYSVEERRPGLLTTDLFTAYLDGKTTLRPYANLIGVDPDSLRDDLECSAGAES